MYKNEERKEKRKQRKTTYKDWKYEFYEIHGENKKKNGILLTWQYF